jgi:hypothetical protein
MSLHICRCSISDLGTEKSSLLRVLEPGRICLSNQAYPTITRQGNPEIVWGCRELDSWMQFDSASDSRGEITEDFGKYQTYLLNQRNGKSDNVQLGN